ncbi:MAG: NAD(P)H-dependent oxidoreductase subunit E [Clostridia bacterium]|nr:NAD(P)H-dependent oxidoreductase subunit E [Clostridia bacterium]
MKSQQASFDTSKIAEIAERYKKEPDQLMSIMMEIQAHCKNGVPREAAAIISSVTGIPEAKLYGYLSFYTVFSTEERGKYLVRMCKSAPCHIRGAKEVASAIGEYLGVSFGETTKDGLFSLELCGCIGLCDTAPAIMINDKVYTSLTPESAVDLIKKYQQGGVQ